MLQPSDIVFLALMMSMNLAVSVFLITLILLSENKILKEEGIVATYPQF